MPVSPASVSAAPTATWCSPAPQRPNRRRRADGDRRCPHPVGGLPRRLCAATLYSWPPTSRPATPAGAAVLVDQPDQGLRQGTAGDRRPRPRRGRRGAARRPRDRAPLRGMSAGWLFSGQGTQYPGMATRAVRQQRRVPRRVRRSRRRDGCRTSACGSARSWTTTAIDRTEFAQPAIFAVQYAQAQALLRLGAEPAWLLGHSIGEYAAAAIAEVFSLDDACRLVVARGRLMQQLPTGGGMLAVARRDCVARRRPAFPLDLAAVNGPSEVVLSGATEAIEDAARTLAASGDHRASAQRVARVPLAAHGADDRRVRRRSPRSAPTNCPRSRSSPRCTAGCSATTNRWTPTTGPPTSARPFGSPTRQPKRCRPNRRTSSSSAPSARSAR